MTSILITGDLCLLGKTGELARDGRVQEIFNDFLEEIEASDYVVTNLECPFIDAPSPILKTGPALGAPSELAGCLSSAGFDLVTLANNHIMDHGPAGLKSTLRSLEQQDIAWVGAGSSNRKAREIFYASIGATSVAFLSFAENEFSTTVGEEPGANPLSLVENYRDIQEARERADHIIVIVHGGHEFFPLPSPRIKSTYRFFVDAGADAVIAHHTHCISGYEIYKSKPIFYGIGNFLFDYEHPHDEMWTEGLGVRIHLSPGEVGFDLIPFVQSRGQVGVRKMAGSELEECSKRLADLNEIVADDTRLELAFKEFVSRREQTYMHFLQPYSNRLLHSLFHRGLVPSMWGARKRRLLLNIVRCESHRDALMEVLKP